MESPSTTPCISPDVFDCSWICVAVPSTTVKQQLEARCLCPDGYTTNGNDCVPLPSNKRPKGLTYVGTSYMKSFCNAETSRGSGCMNGGSCEEVQNAYGRTERIVCNCELPYTGDHCERYDYSLDEAEKLVDRAESSSFWPFFFFFLLLILIAVGFTYFYVTNRAFNDKMHQLGDKIHQSTSNLPPPPSLTAIRDYTHNITRNITRPSWSRGTSPRSGGGNGFSRQSPQRSARNGGGPTDGNVSTSLLVDNYLSPSAYSNPMYNETVVYSTPPDSDSDSPSSRLPASSPSPADPVSTISNFNPLIHSSQNVY
ncbi:hypothetical protein WR25_11031 [Diploscapter pachys]|uniref:EGF-like domain-containing protein n=1 Tax=Diploscapter pachys TaxID=2018661 RepID=A0A2A2K387_9BILA|nr:hypothetical protein WR25_11031 [Diploscapter pachys]